VAGRPRPLQEETFHLDLSRSWASRVHPFGADSVLRCPGKDRQSQYLSAFYALQKLAERDLEGGCQRCQVAQTDLARTSLEVRYMNFVNTRLFGKVDLPPTPFLSELPDSFTKLDANIGRHSSSIDLVEALYLVDALSREHPAKVQLLFCFRVLRPTCRGRPGTDGGGDISPI
jgi:hypothetical protein